MTTTNYPPEVLIEVADLCAQARGNIELYGWRQGCTPVGWESLGLCIGSALAMASDMPSVDGAWDWSSCAGVPLCPGGEVLRDYSVRVGYLGGADDMIASWNDRPGRTEEDVLALLAECEEAMRSDATDIIVGDTWDSLGCPLTVGVA